MNQNMVFDYDEDECDAVKKRIENVLVDDKEEEQPGVVALMALLEIAVELCVKHTGGAVEGTSMFLAAISMAPMVADQYESRELAVH